MATGSNTKTRFQDILIEKVNARQDDIHNWLSSLEGAKELPLYSSVDIRNAGFKAAVVDTNIFPAGFNNLCEHGLKDSSEAIRRAVLSRVSEAKDILIIAEEHTRNTWYLENIRILQEIIENAGFRVKIATFLNVQPAFCDNAKYVELETASGKPVKIYCLKKILCNLGEQCENCEHFDLIILNNDLTTGIPEVLHNAKIPIYPSMKAGWHSRQKSHHFCYASELIEEFARMQDMDPWFFSCLFKVSENANINEAKDRAVLADMAAELFQNIEKKYREHGIKEKPYVVLKADSGTYGMGVLPCEDPKDILELNRRGRNKLYKGKSARVIDRFLLQEGVSTIYDCGYGASEVCIYQIENHLVGGFYRFHSGKSGRDNLNSTGMVFKKMCPHVRLYNDCGEHHDINIFDIYRILARIAGIAAHREIIRLEEVVA